MPHRDWANLPEELLAFTAKKLTTAFHFVRFRSVCRRWRSAASPADHPPQTPWLLLPNSTSSVQSLFCPLSQKTFTLNLPSATAGKSILGSSRGWLLIYEEDSEHLCLLNPLTASHIRLPPLEAAFSWCMKNAFLRNAVLSSDPAAGGGRRLIVMVTTFILGSSKFVFCRLGDASWTMVNVGSPLPDPVSTCHKGSFYSVDYCGRTAICSLSRTDEVAHIPSVHGMTEFYLVESHDGEKLFLVATFLEMMQLMLDRKAENKRNYINCDLWIEVFELDKSKTRPVWSKINGIGGNAMFLSRDGCCCVDASELSSCRKNTVYFVLDKHAGMLPKVKGVGVLDLGNGEAKILHCHPTSPSDSDPQGIWYTPNIR